MYDTKTQYSDNTKELAKAAYEGRLIVQHIDSKEEYRVKAGSDVGSQYVQCGSGAVYNRDHFDSIIVLSS